MKVHTVCELIICEQPVMRCNISWLTDCSKLKDIVYIKRARPGYLNPAPLAPKARIIPLDQRAIWKSWLWICDIFQQVSIDLWSGMNMEAHRQCKLFACIMFWGWLRTLPRKWKYKSYNLSLVDISGIVNISQCHRGVKFGVTYTAVVPAQHLNKHVSARLSYQKVTRDLNNREIHPPC